MINKIRYTFLWITILTLAGCGGANTRYAWNNYDAELYEHYKDPAQKELFIQSMKEIVEAAESEGKVPPGVYAEYGFLLQEKGDISQAINYYQKEAEKWPESKYLMAKLVANTQPKSDKQIDSKILSTELPPAKTMAPTTDPDENTPRIKDTAPDIVSIPDSSSIQSNSDIMEVPK
jgi:hypothetical protein